MQIYSGMFKFSLITIIQLFAVPQLSVLNAAFVKLDQYLPDSSAGIISLQERCFIGINKITLYLG